MEGRRKWWGLLAIMPSLAMIFVDVSVLPVALPSIQQHFAASSIQLEWCINSYLLVVAALVLVGGKLGDWIGHRRTFVIGILLFAFASILCGMSPNVSSLIVARAMQGIGAALMTPASTPLLMSIFPPKERGQATGINVSVSSLFMIIGPLVGGYCTEHFSWRWIFWINLPLALMGLVLTFLFIPRSMVQKPKIDLLGMSYFVMSCTAFVTLFMDGRKWGVFSWNFLSCSTMVLLGAVLLWLREKKAAHPFLTVSLFRHRIFSAVNISIFSTQFIMMISVFRAMFFQTSLGWSPVQAGMVTVLSSAPILFMSPLGGFLSDKLGPKFPISCGFLLMIFSFIWTPLYIDASLPLLMIGLVSFGCSIPLVLTPSYASAMGAIPAALAGSGFGVIATVRSLSATLGVAILGACIHGLELKYLTYLADHTSLTQGFPQELLQQIVMGSASEVLHQLPRPQGLALSQFYQEAQVKSFLLLHWSIAALLVVIFIYVFLLHHRKSSHRLPKSPAEGWD